MRFFIVVLFSTLFSFCVSAQDANKFKSLLVYKIAEYVVWPDNPEKILVGTVGKTPVYDVLSSFAEKRDHISVTNIHHANEIGACHMIYLPEGQEAQLRYFRMKVLDSSVLIVSENKDHITKGADIVIYTENGKLKYIVNENTINGKGMIASKKLASLGASI